MSSCCTPCLTCHVPLRIYQQARSTTFSALFPLRFTVRPRQSLLVAVAAAAAAHAGSAADGAGGRAATKEQRIRKEAAEVQASVKSALEDKPIWSEIIRQGVTSEQMVALAACFLRAGMSSAALKEMLMEQPEILTLHPSLLENKLASVQALMTGTGERCQRPAATAAAPH